MIVTKKALARRTFLRGMGATLALPLLDAMVPVQTLLAQTVARRVPRLNIVYIAHGMVMDQYTPATVGSSFEMVFVDDMGVYIDVHCYSSLRIRT